MKFEIKNRYSGELIIAVDAESWRFAVELAVKQKADLSSADLSSANLNSANLSYADLRSADLRSANLSYADLRYANLSYADLSSANLNSANLSYADLRSADLRSADLRSADLRYANLVVFQYQRNWAYFTLDGTLRIGCEVLPITEWAESFEEIGKKYKYTDLQIKMYGMFIKQCLELFKEQTK